MPDKKQIINILKKIKEPESELSLYELKIVNFIDYEKDDKKLIISLDFNKRMPSCVGCKPIAWMLQKKIVEALKNEFSKFNEVSDVDFKYC